MNGILNGINKQMIILRNSLIIAVLELIGLFIFTSMPNINIYGYVITLIITSVISLIINIYEIKKTIDINISVTNIIIYLLLSLLVFFIFNLIINNILGSLTLFKNIITIILILGVFTFLGTLGGDNYE